MPCAFWLFSSHTLYYSCLAADLYVRSAGRVPVVRNEVKVGEGSLLMMRPTALPSDGHRHPSPAAHVHTTKWLVCDRQTGQAAHSGRLVGQAALFYKHYSIFWQLVSVFVCWHSYQSDSVYIYRCLVGRSATTFVSRPGWAKFAPNTELKTLSNVFT